MEKNKKPPKKNQPDPLKSIKYKGYCIAFTPPGDNMALDDFVNMAKFYLSRKTRRLWKDPVWKTYTDEEILIEYFAHVFSENEEMKKRFEVQIDAGVDLYGEDIFDWLDRMVEENQKEMKEKAESLPDKVSYSPDTNEDVEE